jgi:hypothetical protein
MHGLPTEGDGLTSSPQEHDETAAEIDNFMANSSILSRQQPELRTLPENSISSIALDDSAGTTICGKEVPSKLSDLNQTDRYVTNVTGSVSSDLQLPGLRTKLDKKEVLVISDFMKYKNFICDGMNKRVAVGMRIYIRVKNYDFKNGVNLPRLAASVELGHGTATCWTHLYGVESDNMYANLAPTTFGVDTYSRVINAFDDIIHGLRGDMKIDPLIFESPKE